MEIGATTADGSFCDKCYNCGEVGSWLLEAWLPQAKGEVTVKKHLMTAEETFEICKWLCAVLWS